MGLVMLQGMVRSLGDLAGRVSVRRRSSTTTTAIARESMGDMVSQPTRGRWENNRTGILVRSIRRAILIAIRCLARTMMVDPALMTAGIVVLLTADRWMMLHSTMAAVILATSAPVGMTGTSRRDVWFLSRNLM